MLRPFTEKCIDCSGKDSFAFAFYCDRCGHEWCSAPIPFSRGGFSEVRDSEVLELLWADEHRAAFERANQEAMFYFNHCRVCGQWVCDACFHLSGDAHTDICTDCRQPGKL